MAYSTWDAYATQRDHDAATLTRRADTLAAERVAPTLETWQTEHVARLRFRARDERRSATYARELAAHDRATTNTKPRKA